MEILIDESVHIPDGGVWNELPIDGNNWRLVRKNLVKKDFYNKGVVRDSFGSADKILLFSTPSNPRYGLYLYIADVMKKKDIIFFHFVDEKSDLPTLSFLKGVNIMINHDSRDTLIETLFSKDTSDYLEELLNRVLHEKVDIWLGGAGSEISQHELGKAIYHANRELKFPHNILIFLFGYPSEELVMPLSERGVATVQQVPVGVGNILALQDVRS